MKEIVMREWDEIRMVGELIEVLQKYPTDFRVIGVSGHITVTEDEEKNRLYIE